MKENVIRLISLTTAFVVGLGIAVNVQNKANPVLADQHSGNYNAYTYSGSYYNGLDFDATSGMNGNFRKAVTSLIYPKGWYIYSGSGADHLSGVLQSADEDPTNNKNMVLFYTRDSITKTAATVNGTMIWNREHVWPQSLSINNTGTQCWGTEEAGTDILHLRPTYETCNSFRGNTKYGDCNHTPSQTYNGMTYGYGTKDGTYFEPLDSLKGDIARILMYVWTAYNDHYNGLQLTKVISYDTLLKWHTLDKPDVLEGNRNDYCQTSKQKNRNPFVDHPEYAWKIFGDSCSAQVKNDCIAAYPAEGSGSGGQSSSSQNNSSSQTQSSSQSQQSSVPTTGAYNISFVNSGSDGSAEVTDQNYTNYVAENTLVKSVSNLSKIFPGSQGLKLGSSSNKGAITFTLKEEARNNVEQIIIKSTKYGSDSGNLVVKIDGNTVKSDIVPGNDATISFPSPSTVTNITIETSAKRAYLNSISVFLKQEQDENPSSSSSQIDGSSEAPIVSSQETSSSEEQISSSQEPISSETSITSSQELVSSEEIISSENVSSTNDSAIPEEDKKGCGGSIIASASLLSISSLVGLVFIFSKKKH